MKVTPAQQILIDHDAYLNWHWPDGPWGWNPDGTSKAPTAVERAAHVNWYHDLQEGYLEHPEVRTVLDDIALLAELKFPQAVLTELVTEAIKDAYWDELNSPADAKSTGPVA